MCGICGFVEVGGRSTPAALESLVGAMNATLAHRGPDGSGHWVHAPAGVALGHRRLAIIDVSASGSQPMLSRDGCIALSFNGEIYNYRALRRDLEAEGVQFRGSSDTEVLAEALARWGSEQTLGRILGIFAFAAWDTRGQRLILARDHLGVKPLYWGERAGGLMFASELKALRALPGWSPAIDRDALAGFLRLGQVQGPASIYRGVHQLPPGTWLQWSPREGTAVRAYYDLRGVARAGAADPLGGSEQDARDRLEGLIDGVLAEQMVADVPLGAFLSGGIDSSLVVALMQRRTPQPVRTFTIGFGQRGFDEAAHALAVARHLGTEHTELYVGERELLDLVPRLAEVYDEPFADASGLPTLLVCALARGQVTVALSGDGGDELFAGYNRHLWTERLWGAAARYPAWARRLARAALSAPPARLWDALAAPLPTGRRPRQVGDKLQKAARMLAHPTLAAAYGELRAVWPHPERLVRGAGPVAAPPPLDPDLDTLTALQLADALTYLPDDILTKVDRASMSLGLEVRVPLLDPRIGALAWRLPRALKVRDGNGKWLLRQVLARHLPPALFERPKSGFTVPLDAWLRGPLRDWAESLILGAEPAGGVMDAAPVRRLWRAHRAGVVDAGQRLWTALVALDWARRWAA